MRAFGKNTEKIFPAQSNKIDPSILGNWTAHLVIFYRNRFVLFVNDKTLLTIFISFKPKEKLIQRFQQALFRELLRLEIPTDKAKDETLKFLEFSLEKNRDKSMTSYMKQIIFEYKFMLTSYLEAHGIFEIEPVQKMINETPRIKREHTFPNDYVRELFGLEKQKRIFY